MYLIQILLPLLDNARAPLEAGLFRALAQELTARFGGLTAYTRAPAEGRWQENPDETSRDDIVVYEVMAETLDAEWWRGYRQNLESRFRQERVIVRAEEVQVL